MRYNIHWTSGGLTLFYMLGVTRNMMLLKPELCGPHAQHQYSGVSAGAWCAMIASSDIQPDALDRSVEGFIDQASENDFWGKTKSKDVLRALNIGSFASDRLQIGLTHFPSMKRRWVTDFKGTEDVVGACLASSHIPVLCGSATAIYKGAKYMDGAIGIGPREPENYETELRISPSMYDRRFTRKDMYTFDRKNMKELYTLGLKDSHRWGI